MSDSSVVPPPIVLQELPRPEGSPWLTIWTHPRATLRAILDSDPRRGVLRLAALGGIAGALGFASSPGLGDLHPPLPLFAGAVVCGAIGGLIAVHLFAALLRLTGRWLGGTGSFIGVRAALAWSYVPAIFGLLLWLPRVVFLGAQVFQPEPALAEANPAAALFLGSLQMTEFVLGLWGFVLSLKCLGEAHAFGSWRAFWSLVLAGVLIALPAMVLVAAGWALIHSSM